MQLVQNLLRQGNSLQQQLLQICTKSRLTLHLKRLTVINFSALQRQESIIGIGGKGEVGAGG